MTYVIVLVVLAAVVWVVSAPLRGGGQGELEGDARRDELEAERDAKYREIRDAELDHRMGKLSDADWRTVDRALRAEAIELLRRIDEMPVPSPRGRRSAAAPEPAAVPEDPEAAPPVPAGRGG